MKLCVRQLYTNLARLQYHCGNIYCNRICDVIIDVMACLSTFPVTVSVKQYFCENTIHTHTHTSAVPKGLLGLEPPLELLQKPLLKIN